MPILLGLGMTIFGKLCLCEIRVATNSLAYVNNRTETPEKSVNWLTLFLHSVFRVMKRRLASASQNKILTPNDLAQERQERTKAMDQRLKLLWVNMQISDTENEHLDTLGNYFEIIQCGRDSRLAQYLIEPVYDAICFDFDFPDRASLRLVEETKQLHPSLPMFVITVQHSEELAIWAFRSSMIDFLVKPLADDELMRCYKVLRDIWTAKANQDDRIIKRPDQSLPKTAFHSATDPEQSLQPALYYVEKHFDKKIPAEKVAKLCGISAFRFSRIFKEVFGITFREYLVRYRLREACRLLQMGQPSVTEVAYAVGFNDVSYFSRMFKRYFEVNPSDLLSSQSALDKFESMNAGLHLPLH